MKKIEPTEDEKKNGWTKDKLDAYIRERERGRFLATFYREPERPHIQNYRYSPFKWGR